MEQVARALKRELSRHELGRGRSVPEASKERVRAYTQGRRKQGATLRQISEELGLSIRNVQRWSSARLRGKGRRLTPVAVEVIAEGKAELSVVSPSGYRVEGLGLQEAVSLLRALQ